MQEYDVPVSWTMVGTVKITAESMDDAREKAEATIDDIDLPENGDYLEDSFRIDEGDDD